MGTWPIYKKTLYTTDLNNKKLSFDKIPPHDFYFFPFFSICTCGTPALAAWSPSNHLMEFDLMNCIMCLSCGRRNICDHYCCSLQDLTILKNHIYKTIDRIAPRQPYGGSTICDQGIKQVVQY